MVSTFQASLLGEKSFKKVKYKFVTFLSDPAEHKIGLIYEIMVNSCILACSIYTASW
jgi:hypothetical protein